MVESASYLDVLQAAAGPAQRPSASAVVAALLQAEKTVKQQRLLYPVELLLGNWQLRFATGTRKSGRSSIALGRGFYLPQFVQAQIGFSPANLSRPPELDPDSASEQTPDAPVVLSISNQLQLVGLCLRLTGPARYLNKKNLLAFDFTRLELSLARQTFYRGNLRGEATQTAAFAQQPIGQLPFFSFFLIMPTYIAARGRGGGLAIWTKAD